MTERPPADSQTAQEPSIVSSTPSSRRGFVIWGSSSLLLIIAAGTVPGYLRGDYRSPEEKAAQAETLKQTYEQEHRLTEKFSPPYGGISVRLTELGEVDLNTNFGEAAIVRQSEHFGWNNSRIALPWETAFQYKPTEVLDAVRIDTYRTSKALGESLVPRFHIGWSPVRARARQELVVLEDRPVEINFSQTGRSLFVTLRANEVSSRTGSPSDQGGLTITTVGKSG